MVSNENLDAIFFVTELRHAFDVRDVSFERTCLSIGGLRQFIVLAGHSFQMFNSVLIVEVVSSNL